MTDRLALAEQIERLRKRLEAEASRRNSAYDHYGMGNTPRSVDPDVFDLIERLSATDTEAMRLLRRAVRYMRRPNANDYRFPEDFREALDSFQGLVTDIDALTKGGEA